MIKLEDYYDDDREYMVDSTYCSECGAQSPDGVKIFYVDEFDDALCQDCIMRELIRESIIRPNKDNKEEQMKELIRLYKKVYNENPKIMNIVGTDLYNSEIIGDELTIQDVIDTLTDFICDINVDEDSLNRWFPDYSVTEIETQYE